MNIYTQRTYIHIYIFIKMQKTNHHIYEQKICKKGHIIRYTHIHILTHIHIIWKKHHINVGKKQGGRGRRQPDQRDRGRGRGTASG